MLTRLITAVAIFLIVGCSPATVGVLKETLPPPTNIDVTIEPLPPTPNNSEITWNYYSENSSALVNSCGALASDSKSACGDIEIPKEFPARIEFTLQTARIAKYCSPFFKGNVQVLFGRKGYIYGKDGIAIDDDANREFHDIGLSRQVSTFTINDDNTNVGEHKYGLTVYCTGRGREPISFSHDPKIKNGGGTGCNKANLTCK